MAGAKPKRLELGHKEEEQHILGDDILDHKTKVFGNCIIGSRCFGGLQIYGFCLVMECS